MFLRYTHYTLAHGLPCPLQERWYATLDREAHAKFDEVNVRSHLYLEYEVKLFGQTVSVNGAKYRHSKFESYEKLRARLFPRYPGFTIHFLDDAGAEIVIYSEEGPA